MIWQQKVWNLLLCMTLASILLMYIILDIPSIASKLRGRPINMQIISHNGSIANQTSKTAQVSKGVANKVYPKSLITIFTTFHYSPDKDYIYRNTILNWALLNDTVRPILYYSKSDTNVSNPLITYAQLCGWKVYAVPMTLVGDLPVVRSMFLHAQSVSNTPFYMYSNADILFDYKKNKKIKK